MQRGHAFIPLHKPSNYPLMMGTAQEQAIGAKRFRKNQALFRRCTDVDGVIKKQIVTVVHPVFLSPLIDQLRGFGKVTALHMLQYLFSYYRDIDETDLKENSAKMMGPYKPSKLLARLIDQLEKGKYFKIRREDDCQCNVGIERDHPLGANGCF